MDDAYSQRLSVLLLYLGPQNNIVNFIYMENPKI